MFAAMSHVQRRTTHTHVYAFHIFAFPSPKKSSVRSKKRQTKQKEKKDSTNRQSLSSFVNAKVNGDETEKREEKNACPLCALSSPSDANGKEHDIVIETPRYLPTRLPACWLDRQSAWSTIFLLLINLLTFVKQPNIDFKYQHATVSI